MNLIVAGFIFLLPQHGAGFRVSINRMLGENRNHDTHPTFLQFQGILEILPCLNFGV